MREFQDRLSRRANRVGLSISDELASRLEVYYQLLSKWNAKINLTSLDVDKLTHDALDRVLIEPLVAVRHARPEARDVIDIGSGGGSPAIPFALAGAMRLLMVEAKSRKAAFLNEAIRALEMSTWEVATARWEDLLREQQQRHERPEILTVRAVRLDPKALTRLSALIGPGGEMFLFRSLSSASSKRPPPPLLIKGAHMLVERTGSELLILKKGPDIQT
jgi:16S rRNA (guanine527-N7)-methyltransferase